MIHANGHTYRNALHHELHELLCREAEQRDQRGGTSWMEAERHAMLEAVNHHRQASGKDPVTLADVERVETMACGHTDYGTKFALYCTELVQDTP